MYGVGTDRYHFLKSIPIFTKKFSPIFGQLPIFDWPPIPIFHNLLNDIFADILTKYFVSNWFELLTAPTYGSLTREVD